MRELFREYYRPTDDEFSQLWQEATFVFDTNILLNLYRYTSNTRDDLLRIMEALHQRIWIPHQVGLEFSRNRLSVIHDQNKIFKLIEEFDAFVKEKFIRDIVQKYGKRGHFFADLDRIGTIFQQTKQALQDELDDARTQHPDLMKHDVIFERLDRLFQGRIGSPFSGDELIKLAPEFEGRFKQKIPPGFKDASKTEVHQDDDPSNPSNKYGDAILWFQIIDYSKCEQRPIIFVVDDAKEDWWEQIQGKKLGPRIQLRREMQIKAGVLFYMYNADNFIKHAQDFLNIQVQPATVEEVRDLSKKDVVMHHEGQKMSVPQLGGIYANPAILSALVRQQQEMAQTIKNMGGIGLIAKQIEDFRRSLQFYNNLNKPVSFPSNSISDETASDTLDSIDDEADNGKVDQED